MVIACDLSVEVFKPQKIGIAVILYTFIERVIVLVMVKVCC